MDERLTNLFADVGKPERKYRQLTLRVSPSEFMELQSHCAVRYLNYSDVIRTAINEYLKKNNV